MPKTVRPSCNLILNLPRLGCGNWWVEATTDNPDSLYYFGPFANAEEATEMCPDYRRALHKHGMQQVNFVVRQCYPADLLR